jgi:adenylosuccinate lyase
MVFGRKRSGAQPALGGAAYNLPVSRTTASQPLNDRYASREMSYLFSPEKKFRTWRQLWIALAEAERELGLPISEKQIEELRAAADDINFEEAEKREREVRHDVMSHVHAYGLQAPAARGIIHLGATSAFVTDNADILQMRDGLRLFQRKLVNLMAKLARFAREYSTMPTLAFTHFQPAQLTTVGKRAALWLHDLVLDHEEVMFRLDSLALLGVKGATGTQASFLKLFEGDAAKVRKLEEIVV